MTFKLLPIGQFIQAKRHISRVGDILTPLYNEVLPADAGAVLAEAQGEWQKFTALAVEGEVEQALADVGQMSYTQVRELAQDFFGRQVGSVQK